MIDLRVRPHLQWLLQPIGRALNRLGVTPLFLTVLGLALTLVGALMIGMGRLVSGAVVAVTGSLLDGLDGSVARAAGTQSARGALLDATADRIGEIAVLGGLAAAVASERRLVLLVIAALGGSMLVPYLRARAEAAGLDGRGGMMGRAERVILFTLGLVLGQVEPMLWILVIATWATVVWRFLLTYNDLR